MSTSRHIILRCENRPDTREYDFDFCCGDDGMITLAGDGTYQPRMMSLESLKALIAFAEQQVKPSKETT